MDLNPIQHQFDPDSAYHEDGPVAQLEPERRSTKAKVESSSLSGATKTCTRCKVEKPLTEFGMRSIARNIRQWHCLECGRAINKREYALKKPAHIARAAKGRRKKLDWIIGMKSRSPCLDCNVLFPYYVMDFDHRPGTDKKFNLHNRGITSRGMKTILAEIAKCDLICSNCHRARTYNRIMGRLAQQEEHPNSNRAVEGSSPSAITNAHAAQ
jgi:hypothetical protein